MKRIVLLACGLLLMVASTAEARRSRNGGSYSQPISIAPAAPSSLPAQPVGVEPVATSTPAVQPVRAVTAVHSTKTAQGVANIMASYGTVGHWGGNPGYEGCGMGATPEAAYSSCCYASSGMATVDVGYARGTNGWWFCCRRYR
jgi:hypothetical protein